MAALTPPFYHFSPTRNTRSQGKHPWEAIPNPSLGDFEKAYNTNRHQHWFYCSFHLYKAACRQTAPFQPTLSLQELEELYRKELVHSHLTLSTTKQSCCSRSRMGLLSLPSKACGQVMWVCPAEHRASHAQQGAETPETQLSLLTKLEKSSTSQTSFLLT